VTPVSVNPGIPVRLRGRYHWNILLSTPKPETASAFLKKSLKDFRRSGIIVTVDMDPV
jgi:primosomal protein N'